MDGRPTDPLQHPAGKPGNDGASLFQSAFAPTSQIAHEGAQAAIGNRRQRILRFLKERGPATIFEVAAELCYSDHQISGRFGELESDGLIRKTGERKIKPETKCVCEVYAACHQPDSTPKDRADLLGYPLTLSIPSDGTFDREPVFSADNLPGVPYARRGGDAGRQIYRVALVECDGCGRPLKMIEDRSGPTPRKFYRCGRSGCNTEWELLLVQVPGQCPHLALVMKRL